MNSWHSLVSLRFVTIFAVTFEAKKTQPGRCSFFSNQAVKITGMLDIMVANPFVHLKPTDLLERFCQNWNLQVEIWADFLPQNPSGQTTTTLETRIHPPPQNPPKTITPKINKLKTVRRLPKFKDCNFSGKVTRCNGWLNLSPKDKLCNFDGSCTSCDQVTTTTAPWGELKTAVGYHYHVIPKKNATTNNHVDESKAGTPFGLSTFLQGLG